MRGDERQRLIETRKQQTGRKERLWARDQWRDFDVWQVPVEGLMLNVDNRRFAAERTLMEERLGHEFDPENNPDDERALETMLLDVSLDVDDNRVVGTPGKDYQALKSDWIKRRQESPIWIRPEGLVRNGNRRLAMLKRLQREEGLEGFEYVDAVILNPDDIDEVALFDMEQREQLTENLKVRYTDINLLLAIRAAAQARQIDWFDRADIQRVAGELQHIIGNDQGYAIVQLNAIKYMDAYLDDSGQTGQYHKLINQIERFRDVGRAMAQIEVDYPDDAPEMLRLLFAAIRAGLPHGKIRDLRRMFRFDRERHNELVGRVDAVEQGWQASNESQTLADPEVVHPDAVDLEDEGDEPEPPGPNVPNYPKAEITDVVEDALDGYQASKAVDILTVMRQLLNRVEILTDRNSEIERALASAGGDEIRSALRVVVDWADRLRVLI